MGHSNRIKVGNVMDRRKTNMYLGCLCLAALSTCFALCSMISKIERITIKLNSIETVVRSYK